MVARDVILCVLRNFFVICSPLRASPQTRDDAGWLAELEDDAGWLAEPALLEDGPAFLASVNLHVSICQYMKLDIVYVRIWSKYTAIYVQYVYCMYTSICMYCMYMYVYVCIFQSQLQIY